VGRNEQKSKQSHGCSHADGLVNIGVERNGCRWAHEEAFARMLPSMWTCMLPLMWKGEMPMRGQEGKHSHRCFL
jgi:hypothetical protein